MKKITLILCSCMIALLASAQKNNDNSALKLVQAQEKSTLRAAMHADSVRIKKEFAFKMKVAKVQPLVIYPVLNAGQFSGIVPVKDRTEIPDTNMDYKLLFEIAFTNPDSTIKEINSGLVEVARVINLHVASGIPLKKIHVVIVMHGPGIRIAANNTYYEEHFKVENPNIKTINQLSDLGARFIVCGQSMAYGEVKSDMLLPQIKVSLTAQTVLTSYQLKGYVKNTLQQ